MTTKNLLKESILQVELLKQASAQATKDSILQKLSEDVKRRLRQQEEEEQQEVQEEDEEPIEVPEEEQQEEIQQAVEQDDDQLIQDSSLQDIDAEIEEALNDIDLDQEQDEMIDMTEQQDYDMDEDAKLQNEIQEQLLDAEIQEQLNNSGLDDDQISEQEQTIQQEVDQQLFEKIKGLINNQLEQEDSSEQEVVAEFKKRVKKLTSENKKYKSTINKIKQDLYETRMLNLKGKLLVSLFSKFDLTKKQQMKIIEKLDTVDSQKNIKLMYSRLVQGLRQNKNIVKKHKPNLISDTVKSTRSKNNKNTKTGKDLDESLAPIRDIFRRKVGILN